MQGDFPYTYENMAAYWKGLGVFLNEVRDNGLRQVIASRKTSTAKYTAVAIGACTAGYLGYKGVVKVKEHVQRQKVGYFVGGFSTCLLLAGGVVLVRRFTFPSPDRLLERVMPMLRANSEVRSILGSNIRPGLFKAYAYVGGWSVKSLQQLRSAEGPILSRVNPFLRQDKTLQLMFQVNGTHSSAMVSLEASRQRSERAQFKSLALDFANGERLILKGTVDDVVFQGVTRLR